MSFEEITKQIDEIKRSSLAYKEISSQKREMATSLCPPKEWFAEMFREIAGKLGFEYKEPDD